MNPEGKFPHSAHAHSGAAAETLSPQQLQAVLPGFAVIEMIGHGGMGTVYRAQQISLDRMVAIKLLPRALSDATGETAERFREEARMMARLMHPGIITVFDFGATTDGRLYFVMEYVKGIDVAHMIAQQGKLQPLHALSITAHVCDTLSYAHGQGIIHCDIKPGNVMVDMEGRVKVADFGLASLAAQQSSRAENATTLGTPDYIAPEGLLIGMQVDHRADLYSLGVMLYEMLTGKVPGHPPVPPSVAVPGIDSRFDAVVARALETNPDLRYQNAAQLRKDLDQIITVPVARTATTRPVPTRTPQPRRQHNQPLRTTKTAKHSAPKNDIPWGLILVVFVALAGAVYLILQYNSSNRREEPGKTTPQRLTQPDPTDRIIKPKKETATTRALREWYAKFNSEMDREVTKAHAAAVADLDSKYVAALDREIARAEDSGSNSGLDELRAEKEHARTSLTLPAKDAKDLPSNLKRLRETYRASLDKLVTDRDHHVQNLCEKHGRILSSMRDELIRAGKHDEAAEVDAKLREIRQMRYSIGTGSP